MNLLSGQNDSIKMLCHCSWKRGKSFGIHYFMSTAWINGKVGIYGEVVKEGECPLLIFKREGFSQRRVKEREEISSANRSALVMAKMIAQQ